MGFLVYKYFLTGASLSPTENKRCSDFFLVTVVYFFQDWNQSKLKVLSNTISMSNILHLNDNQHFARSDQGLNCLQTKVISKTNMQKVQIFHQLKLFWFDLRKWTFFL